MLEVVLAITIITITIRYLCLFFSWKTNAILSQNWRRYY